MSDAANRCNNFFVNVKKYAVGQFVGLKKTWYNPEIINNLEECGIWDIVLNWIKSYLSNSSLWSCVSPAWCAWTLLVVFSRCQCWAQNSSLYMWMTCKVSLFFFAGDANIFCAVENLQELLEDLRKLEKWKLWFDNKLSATLDKTKIMISGNGKMNIPVHI